MTSPSLKYSQLCPKDDSPQQSFGFQRELAILSALLQTSKIRIMIPVSVAVLQWPVQVLLY